MAMKRHEAEEPELKLELTSIVGKEPIVSLDAEQAVLGSCLISTNATLKAIGIVDAKDFSSRLHQLVFAHIQILTEKGVKPDTLTVVESMKGDPLVERELGKSVTIFSYIIDLASAPPTASHVEYYAKIVKDKAYRRRLQQICVENLIAIKDETRPIDDLIAEFESDVHRIGVYEDESGVKPVGDLAHGILEHLAEKPEKPVLLSTGMRRLDSILGGGLAPSLTIIAGRTGMGKTAFALNIARNVVQRGIPTLVFSMEMSSRQLIFRMITSLSGIPYHVVESGGVPDNMLERACAAAGVICDYPLFLDERPHQSVEMVRGKIRELHSRVGLGLVVVDYLQIMRLPTHSETTHAGLSHIMRCFMEASRENNIPTVIISQFNRAGVKAGREQGIPRRPELHDLRDSGSVEENAYSVIALHRPESYIHKMAGTEVNDEVAEVIVLKNRGGACGIVEMAANLPTFTFTDLQRSGGEYYE